MVLIVIHFIVDYLQQHVDVNVLLDCRYNQRFVTYMYTVAYVAYDTILILLNWGYLGWIIVE